MLVPNGLWAIMSAITLSGIVASTYASDQMTNGTISDLIRFTVSRFHHPCSSRCCTKKNPDTTKKNGTAILAIPPFTPLSINHPSDSATSLGHLT